MEVAVFLRGINVGGVAIKMVDLKAVFVDMGLGTAKTYLATGNVKIDLPEEADLGQWKVDIEKALETRFGAPIPVYLRTTGQLRHLLKDAEQIEATPDDHLYAVFCDEAARLQELERAFEASEKSPRERVLATERALLWRVEKGGTLASAFGNKVLGGKQYKALVTTRNLNTIQKMV